MAKVILQQEAIDDLNDIWSYTFEEWSEKQADKYYVTLSFRRECVPTVRDVGKRLTQDEFLY